jgi:hypothetical protein
MAVLSDPDRAAISALYQSECSSARIPIPLTRAQVRAAIDAVDAWADANAASYNSALPAAARNNLTSKEKASLLVYVLRRRWEIT